MFFAVCLLANTSRAPPWPPWKAVRNITWARLLVQEALRVYGLHPGLRYHSLRPAPASCHYPHYRADGLRTGESGGHPAGWAGVQPRSSTLFHSAGAGGGQTWPSSRLGSLSGENKWMTGRPQRKFLEQITEIGPWSLTAPGCVAKDLGAVRRTWEFPSPPATRPLEKSQ